MVLPAASEGVANAIQSARAENVTLDTIVGRFQREMWNIRLS
jgi:hypothetical protein